MTAVLLGRCNPYGAETGGPRHVLGGLYGPASAATPPEAVPGLPAAVAQGEWACPQPAQVRCRMICRCGHRGQLMQLCSEHDETTGHSEMIGGQHRWITRTVRQRGHYEEIQRRQAGACPRCLFPAPYAELQKEIQAWQRQLMFFAGSPADWYSPPAASLRQRIDDAGQLMDMAVADGTIHRCPLTLVPVS